MVIEEIKEYCQSGKIQWTEHCIRRLIQRNISRQSVKDALSQGKIIEEYPSDYPFPSSLVLGFTIHHEALHVVCGIGKERLWIITAYRPDLEKWDNSYSQRKEQK